MGSWEPTFVAVVGGSGIERATLVRGLIAALRSHGITATSLKNAGQPVRCGSRPRDRAPFWEMAVVFVEGFAGCPIPRIVLAAPGEPVPRHAFTGGDVIAVVDAAALGAPAEPLPFVLGGIVQELRARMPGEPEVPGAHTSSPTARISASALLLATTPGRSR